MCRHDKWVKIDNFKRKLYLKYVVKKYMLGALIRSRHVSLSRRYLAYFYLIRLPKISAKTTSNKRCVLSGRVWSVNKKTGLSRFELRREVYKSNIPGFRRSSW